MMLYLYLDESGDLGFDFFAKKPSKYFTVTVMLVQGMENRKKIAKAVKRTLQNKFPQSITELKGSKQSIEVKRYFYRHIESVPFELYALTLNKRRVYDYLSQKKDRVYNFIARKVLDVIPFANASVRVGLVIDRSKGKKEIKEFDGYLIRQLSGRIEPRIPLDIDHHLSHEDLPLQAVDLFSWGIFRKYEKGDRDWFDVFKSKSSMMMFIWHKKKSVPCGCVPSGLANLRKGTPKEPTAVLPLIHNMTQGLHLVKHKVVFTLERRIDKTIRAGTPMYIGAPTNPFP